MSMSMSAEPSSKCLTPDELGAANEVLCSEGAAPGVLCSVCKKQITQKRKKITKPTITKKIACPVCAIIHNNFDGSPKEALFTSGNYHLHHIPGHRLRGEMTDEMLDTYLKEYNRVVCDVEDEETGVACSKTLPRTKKNELRHHTTHVFSTRRKGRPAKVHVETDT